MLIEVHLGSWISLDHTFNDNVLQVNYKIRWVDFVIIGRNITTLYCFSIWVKQLRNDGILATLIYRGQTNVPLSANVNFSALPSATLTWNYTYFETSHEKKTQKTKVIAWLDSVNSNCLKLLLRILSRILHLQGNWQQDWKKTSEISRWFKCEGNMD